MPPINRLSLCVCAGGGRGSLTHICAILRPAVPDSQLSSCSAEGNSREVQHTAVPLGQCEGEARLGAQPRASCMGSQDRRRVNPPTGQLGSPATAPAPSLVDRKRGARLQEGCVEGFPHNWRLSPAVPTFGIWRRPGGGVQPRQHRRCHIQSDTGHSGAGLPALALAPQDLQQSLPRWKCQANPGASVPPKGVCSPTG